MEGDNARILVPESSGHVGCIHLNGKDVTSTHASSTTISGSGGQLNIMGSGNVKGGASSGATTGSTIHINTSGKTGSVNLYGGTYREYESTDAVVVSVYNNGGAVNVYEGATVAGDIYVGAANLREAKLGIYGGTVTGTVSYAGAEKEFTCVLETSGQVQIKKLVVPARSDVTLQGAPVIKLMEMGLGAQIKVSGLVKGTSVTVRGSGVFAEASDRAADYARYFQAYFAADSIVAEGTKLVNAVDYTPYLSPWETDVIA